MKRAILFLAVLLSLITCRKEETKPISLDVTVSGQISDIRDHQGMPGMTVSLHTYAPDYRSWMQVGQVITDTAGRFSLTVQKPVEDTPVFLKLKSIPDGYQRGARVNGLDRPCILISDNDLTIMPFAPEVEDGRFYQIELMPYTYARILRPAFPSGSEGDTVALAVTNLYLPFSAIDANCTGGWCTSSTCKLTFAVSQDTVWDGLAQYGSVGIGNTVTLQYAVWNNTKAVEKITAVDCAWGDTTDITLDLSY